MVDTSKDVGCSQCGESWADNYGGQYLGCPICFQCCEALGEAIAVYQSNGRQPIVGAMRLEQAQALLTKATMRAMRWRGKNPYPWEPMKDPKGDHVKKVWGINLLEKESS